MKKILLSAVACMFAMFVAATETAYVRITLKSASGTNNALRLSEDDANTNAFEDGADADKMMNLSNSKSVLLYAFVEDHTCGNVVALNLDGLKLGFTTNKVDDTYTLSFDQFSGRELKLYDAVKDEVITINASTPDYEFTVDASQVGQVAIADRFSIGEPASLDFEICHRYGKLQIAGYDGAVVVKDAEGTEKINQTLNAGRAQKEITLADYITEAGYYTVELEGKTPLVIKID